MSHKKSPGQSRFKLMEPVAIDRWPRGINCNNGFKLLGTPLGFSGSLNPGLLFIADVDDPLPTRGQRIICTLETAAAIDAQGRGFDALTLEYDRKIRLGRMDIRLLPAGVTAGSAQLEVRYKNRRILYFSKIRTSLPLSTVSAEIPQCDLLLLNSPYSDPRPLAPKTAAKRLSTWATESLKAADSPPLITCGTLGASIETASALKDIGVTVHAHRPIFDMLRRMKNSDSRFPALVRLNQNWPKDGLVLYLSRLWPESTFFGNTETQIAYAGPGKAVPPFAAVGFRIGETEDRRGLMQFIDDTGAAQVALGPHCNRDLAESLNKKGLETHFVESPKQMSLPLF